MEGQQRWSVLLTSRSTLYLPTFPRAPRRIFGSAPTCCRLFYAHTFQNRFDCQNRTPINLSIVQVIDDNQVRKIDSLSNPPCRHRDIHVRFYRQRKKIVFLKGFFCFAIRRLETLVAGRVFSLPSPANLFLPQPQSPTTWVSHATLGISAPTRVPSARNYSLFFLTSIVNFVRASITNTWCFCLATTVCPMPPSNEPNEPHTYTYTRRSAWD